MVYGLSLGGLHLDDTEFGQRRTLSERLGIIMFANRSAMQSYTGSYHKRPFLNTPTPPLQPMFKTAKFQIRQRSYPPNL